MLPDEHLNCLSWLSTSSFKSNYQSAQTIMFTRCNLVTMTLAIMSIVIKTVKEMCLQLVRCSAVIIKVVHFKCNHSFPKQNKWLTQGKRRSELTRRNVKATLTKAGLQWIMWMIGSHISPTTSIITFWWIPFVVKFYSFSLCKISFIHHTKNIYPAILLHLNITTTHFTLKHLRHYKNIPSHDFHGAWNRNIL